jgi:hypothetical protein
MSAIFVLGKGPGLRPHIVPCSSRTSLPEAGLYVKREGYSVDNVQMLLENPPLCSLEG